MKNKRNNIRSLAVAGVVIGLVLAACGDPDDQPGAAAGAGGQLPEVVLPQNPGWNLGYFDRGVVEQAQRQQRPASRGVEIELELQKRAREASVVEHPGWNLGYFDRGVVEQARVQQGPQSQFAAIEEALEAHADEVTAQNAEAADEYQSEPGATATGHSQPDASAQEIIARYEAMQEAKAEAFNRDGLVPDLQMR